MLEKGVSTPAQRPFFPAIRASRVLAPPDPLLILARLSGLPGRVGLLTLEPPAPGLPWVSYLGAWPSEAVSDRTPPGGVDPGPPALASGPPPPSPWGHVPSWIGLLPYEATRSSLERPAWTPAERRPAPHHTRALWCRYDAVLVIDHREGSVWCVGDDPERCRALKSAAERPRSSSPEGSAEPLPSEPPEAHRARVEAALELIRAGDIYQVNLARRIDVALRGDPLDVFRRMASAAPSAFSALIELPESAAVYSTTPELFLRALPSGHVETWPIKGTRRRGRDASEDLALRLALDADPKERAELSMVIDLERNDLGKLALTGSVRVPAPPRVVTHRTLHHRVARVAAQLPPATTWDDLLTATLPSGSVTGAPKVRAMEVIAALESARRGLYTGALGAIHRDGSLTLAMAIRTLTAHEGVGHYHVGGGIVADSDPDREVEETRVKALQLTATLRG